MKHVVGFLSDVVNNGLGPAYFVSVLGPKLPRGLGFVFLLLDRWFTGSERDLPLKVRIYPRHEGRLGAAPSSQGPAPGVAGEAPQGLQGVFGARGVEERKGGRSGRSLGGLEEGGGRGHAAKGVDHDGRGGCVQDLGRCRLL